MHKAIAPVVFLSFLLFPLSPAAPVEKGLVGKGELLVRENCSRCHAIGKEGDSPHPPAPPFRTLSSKYPVENLAEFTWRGHCLRSSRHADLRVWPAGRGSDHRVSEKHPG